ncbi:MAG: hypothetical protein J7497_04145 [Chitinophagaceae bacterium]|nr:hypothetical protein [Chitinophagaceae bacterium]
MRLNIIIIGLLFLSCNDRQHLSEKGKDSVVASDTLVSNIDSVPEMNMPIIFSTGVADTVISFSVEGLSSEGSEIKAHYINDTITEAQWDIFGETGKTTIKYVFFKNGYIQATEKQYLYKVQISDVKSPNDITLKDTISYLLDTGGIIKTVIDKDFTDVYPGFKSKVPLVLKEK